MKFSKLNLRRENDTIYYSEYFSLQPKQPTHIYNPAGSPILPRDYFGVWDGKDLETLLKTSAPFQ